MYIKISYIYISHLLIHHSLEEVSIANDDIYQKPRRGYFNYFFIMEMNWLAFTIAVLVTFFIWFLRYGPIFGKKWAWYMGMTDEDMKWSEAKDMILHFITILVMIFVHFNVMYAFGAETVAVALEWAFYTRLGYFLMREIGSVIWSKNQERWLLWINWSYWLVVLITVSLMYVLV